VFLRVVRCRLVLRSEPLFDGGRLPSDEREVLVAGVLGDEPADPDLAETVDPSAELFDGPVEEAGELREASRPLDGPDYEDSIKIEAMTGWIDGLPGGMEPYRVGLCLNLDGNSAEGWWTIWDPDVLHEHEVFGSAPSPVLRQAFGTIVCEPG